ncbi:MAG: citrate synthase [Saccharolobus sp.]
MSVVSKGLENVIIKTTNLTFIDGEKGILRYRGYDINDLVKFGSYEETIYLMLYGKLPNSNELNKLKEKLNEEYEVPQEVIDTLYLMPRDSDAIGLLEVGTSALASIDKGFKWKENDKEKAISIIAKMSTLVANVFRRKEGNKPRIPEPSDSYAKSFLSASFAKEPSKDEIYAMDKTLILYADHEVPASTTAALVACSTLSDMYSSLTAALAALKGPLHGGAAEEAFKQYVEIGDPNNVEKWFDEKIINQKNRLMGFGHRVYKTYDPRAKIFKNLALTLIDKNPEAKKYFEIAQKLEELGIKHFSSKQIYPNTDYYSGIVFYALGFPIYMFTALFALSRTLGWLAHIIEYVEEQHRLIRPRALYIGPEYKQYVPLSQR